MSTTESKIKLTFAFADSATRTIEISPYEFSAPALENAKSKVKNLRRDLSPIAAYYISDGGASCTDIIAADVITTTSTEINIKE